MIRYYYKTVRSKGLQVLDNYKPGSWVYVEAPKEEEIAELAKAHDLDESVLMDALDEDEMPRIERGDGVTYMFTRFPYTTEGHQLSTVPVLVLVKDGLLMTISSQRLARIDKFLNEKVDFYTTQRTKLMLQIFDQIVDHYEVKLNSISRQIKTIRARLKVEEIRNKDFVDFVLIEDILNEYLSALTPTNSILRRLHIGKQIKLYAEDQDRIEDLLLNNEQSVEVCKSSLKTIVNIREAYSTIMTNNLNRVIRLLTVLTVIISVPTLISSIYGMNVDLPFKDSEGIFSIILMGSVLISLLLLLMFKRRNWL